MEKNWENAILNKAEDSDLVSFLWSLEIGMSKPHYTLGAIKSQIDNNYVRKNEVIGIYFDDLINSCETREEMLDYIDEVIAEWEN